MTLQRFTQLLHALSDETRARIFLHLLESPDPMHSAFIAGVVEIREPLASYHLKKLADVQLVIRIPSGRFALFVADRRTLYELTNFFAALCAEYPVPSLARKESDLSEEQHFTGNQS